MRYSVLALLALCASPALSDPPVIEAVRADGNGSTYTFHVTIRHGDTGWDDYADGWRVLDMDGNELGMRVLYHPHVNEQPFTRSLSGVTVPSGTTQVQIQARGLVDGWSEDTVTVTLD